MGWPAHEPELYDELQKQAFLDIMTDLLGDLPEAIHEAISDKENFYYWMDKEFGSKFSLRVCQEAEANYWSNLVQAVMERKEAHDG